MKEKKSELWVGIFVVIGIFLFVAMTLKIEKFPMGKGRLSAFTSISTRLLV
jgi:hypothetical protein